MAAAAPDKDSEKIIEDMIRIIEIQRKVITEELYKAKTKQQRRSSSTGNSIKQSPEAAASPLYASVRPRDLNASTNGATPKSSLHHSRSTEDVIETVASSSEDAAATKELRKVYEELARLSSLNDKLTFAEESVDRLEIALKQSASSPNLHGILQEDKSVLDHLALAKHEVSRLKSANDEAAVQVVANQEALDAMDEKKVERRLALKRLEYDVNVIEKEGRKLAKEYEKVLSITIDESLLHVPEAAAAGLDEDPEDIYKELKQIREDSRIACNVGSSLESSEAGMSPSKNSEARASPEDSTSSGNSSYQADEDATLTSTLLGGNTSLSLDSTLTSTTCLDIRKDRPISSKNLLQSSNGSDTNSDTGLSSLHTSSDEGVYEVGTLV